jgi:hypothetical protein
MAAILPVEISNISIVQTAHERGNVKAAWVDVNMNMVAHQGIAIYLAVVLFFIALKQRQIIVLVLITLEKIHFTDAPGHHMIHGFFRFLPGRSWHDKPPQDTIYGYIIPYNTLIVKNKRSIKRNAPTSIKQIFYMKERPQHFLKI